MINHTCRPYDLASLPTSRRYRSLARAMRGRKRDMRRRAFLSALICAAEAAGVEKVTGCEIGVRFGALSEYLLEECPFVSRLYCIDPWTVFPEEHPDKAHHSYARGDVTRWDMTMRHALKRLVKFGGRVAVLRTTSLDAARTCEELGERHWFVYIDASHAYSDVLDDCRAWWPLVAPGGLLCGDDVNPENRWKGDQRDDVSRAVFDFCREIGQAPVLLHRNWFLQK